MEFHALLKTPFPLILIPSVCWLLSLAATRKMKRTSQNLFSGLSALVTILLMIALILFRSAAPYAQLSPPRDALWFGVALWLLCGVGIFLRAWGLYNRETLSGEEIAPYCKAGFLILSGAALSFVIAYLGAAE